MVQSAFPIVWRDLFIENAFERRFQAVLRSAWQKRAWYVIVADPGSGKTTGIIDLVRTTGSPSGTLSGRRYPILAVACPKDDGYEQTLGDYLYRALGLPLKGHWRVRKGKLMGLLVEYGVQCLVFDDAHDLSIPHLTFIKELTDQGCLPPYNHRLGLCLVTAGRGRVMPLKDTLDQQETLWIQFRHRLDKQQPFCRIAGHTKTEVLEILATLETLCREAFPQLNLRRWGDSIYGWLTHPLLDPTTSGRVVMDHLMKLVSNALEWSYEDGLQDVSAEMLEKAAELLTLGRNAIWLIDGEGPTVEMPRSDTTQQEREQEAEAGEAKTSDDPKQQASHHDEAGETQRAVPPTNCAFSGPIELEMGRLMESKVELVQCPTCGSVSKAKVKGQSVMISLHLPRRLRPVRNVTRWVQRGAEWGLVQKKEADR
ncbi:MAG TPA: ATP-binding protein [Ktedonobacteraceae bacterium]